VGLDAARAERGGLDGGDVSARDELRLSTGRVVEAHCGIVGLGPDLDVTHGYDGNIAGPDDGDWSEKAMAPADAVALADLMLARWAAYRAKWAKTT